MPKIHSVKEPFDLTHLKLSNPINKNGSHFIKTLAGEDPLYFLAPKCFVKQGFVNHGKKIFCDFVFSNEDSEFLAWLENLEETVRSTIYTNREKWFETPLDEHDIESSMSAPYKFYKSGKFFILRANVPTALGKINIKIYDEQEAETDPENVKENTNALAVFEFQGIKCSVRSFQFEIELKQLMLVEPEKLFDKCIISKSSKPSSKSVEPNPPIEEPVEKINLESDKTPDSDPDPEPDLEPEPAPTQDSFQPIEAVLEDPNPESVTLEENAPSTNNAPADSTVVEIIDMEATLDKSIESSILEEPPLKIKSKNDIYYKMYKDLRIKAREAKKIALEAYVKARKIKSTYMLEDVSDSDDDLDEFN